MELNYKPIAQLDIYQSDENYYCEISDIKKGERCNTRALTEEDFNELIDIEHTMKSNPLLKGRIDDRILYYDFSKLNLVIIWYNKSMYRDMVFSKSSKMKSGKCIQPGFIYRTNGESLQVYAYRGSKPTDNSKMYQAPYFNVSNNGNVCLGSISHIKNYNNVTEYLNMWEHAFWNSEFTHSSTSKLKKENIGVFWNNLIKENPSKFPYKELKPIDNILCII